jgi:phytoene desaturase
VAKAIIIGAGIAGIATAIRLRQQGFEVSVYEANEYAGGKLSQIEVGAYRFDAGPSLFTMPQYVEELFNLANQDIKPHFEYIKKDIVCQYFFADDTCFTAYSDTEKYINEAARIFDVRAEILRKYLNNSQQKFELTKNIFLHQSLHRLKTYLSTDTIKALINIGRLHINESLHAVNRRFFTDNRLVQLFDRYATYNGSSPYQTPGIMSMIPHLEQHFGTFLPRGGMVSITNSLVALAKSLGVQFYFNQYVERIVVANHVAKGILAEGELQTADVVVSNMDIVPSYRKLLPDEPAPERVLNQERASSALIFYWGISQTFNELDLHNIFFAKDYESEFKAIFEQKNVADDITVYVNITSKDEPTDAPQGHENWFVMVNVPANSGQDWDAIIARTRRNIIAKLSNQLKTNIEPLIVCESILDPRSIEYKTESYRGSLYGAASNDKFAAFLRHPNFSQHIKNLYFCGGSVHPGGGIPLCLLSAKIVAELVEKDSR